MTVTDITTRSRRRPVPVSTDVEALRRALADPACAGWADEIRTELDRLTGTATKAA